MIPLYGPKLERGQETQADPSRAALSVACDGQPHQAEWATTLASSPKTCRLLSSWQDPPTACLQGGVTALLPLPHPSSEEGAVQLAEAPGGELLAAGREQAGGGPALHSGLSHRE